MAFCVYVGVSDSAMRTSFCKLNSYGNAICGQHTSFISIEKFVRLIFSVHCCGDGGGGGDDEIHSYKVFPISGHIPHLQYDRIK